MAQSRERRNQRRPRPSPPTVRQGPADPRRRTLRRIVIAFIVVIGLAGVLAITAPAGDPDGAPPTRSAESPPRSDR